MNSRHAIASFLLFLLLPLNLAANASLADIPKDFVAVYKAKYHGISVTATRKLETLSDGSQVFSFVADSWLADLEEATHFRWNESDHIVPLEYRYKRSALGKDSEETLRFDWDEKTAVSYSGRKSRNMELPELALDKLSFQLQIRTDLLNGKPLLRYDIADDGRLRHYNFKILGEEQITTPVGSFSTVKVERLREDAKRKTVMWLARDWDYLVVRLQQTEEDGASYRIDLHNATMAGEAVKGS